MPATGHEHWHRGGAQAPLPPSPPPRSPPPRRNRSRGRSHPRGGGAAAVAPAAAAPRRSRSRSSRNGRASGEGACRNGPAEEVWRHPQHLGTVTYYIELVGQPGAGQEALPLALYFPAMWEASREIADYKQDFDAIALEPFWLVVPVRPHANWWFIDEKSEYGWITGRFQPSLVALFCDWIVWLAGNETIDSRRMGLLGFSAGAYAVAEILALGVRDVHFAGIGLGGLHGHGQWNLAGVPAPIAARSDAREKFSAFLGRLHRHRGARWIEVTHGRTDVESQWEDAWSIIEVISAGQERHGLPKVNVRLLEPWQQDHLPTNKRNTKHHNYWKVSFLRQSFLVALFGGPPPPADEPVEPPWRHPKRSALPVAQAPTRHVVLHPRQASTVTLAAKEEVKEEVKEDDDEMKEEDEDTPPEAATAGHFEWDAGTRRKHRWRRYNPEVEEQLRRVYARRRGRGQVQVEIDGYAYTVDFDSMLQIAHHSSYERGLRFVQGDSWIAMA